jgi:hypothetical protein
MATLMDFGLFREPFWRPPVFVRPFWNRVAGHAARRALRCEPLCSLEPMLLTRNDSQPGRPVLRRVPWKFAPKSPAPLQTSSALPPSPLARTGTFA